MKRVACVAQHDRDIGFEHRGIIGARNRRGILQIVETQMQCAARRHSEVTRTDRFAINKKHRDTCARVTIAGIEDARGFMADESGVGKRAPRRRAPRRRAPRRRALRRRAMRRHVPFGNGPALAPNGFHFAHASPGSRPRRAGNITRNRGKRSMDGTVCADRLFCGSALSWGAMALVPQSRTPRTANKKSAIMRPNPPVMKTSPNLRRPPAQRVRKSSARGQILSGGLAPPGTMRLRASRTTLKPFAFSRLNFNPLTSLTF